MAVATKSKTRFQTRHDLAESVRQGMIALLNQHLADLFDLYSQTKQAHWNVRGIHFISLHEFFDELAAGLPELVDIVAERANTLGGYASGTTRMAASASRIPEFPTDISEGDDMLEALAERFAIYAKFAREAINAADEADDKDTADIFTEISRSIDKSLWFIEAHLQ